MEKDRGTETAVISDKSFKLGTNLAIILLAFGVLNSLGVTDAIRNKLGAGNWNGPPVCADTRAASLPSANSYVEQKVGGWDCLSGLVDLPSNLKGANYGVPGETKIYECKNDSLGSCSFKFLIPDKKYYANTPIFPKSFRMMGKPGTAWFGSENASKKKAKNQDFPKLDPESEKRIKDIEKAVQEIKKMRKRNKI